MAKIKPAKPGFLAANKPWFLGLKIGGLPGFSGPRDWKPYVQPRVKQAGCVSNPE